MTTPQPPQLPRVRMIKHEDGTLDFMVSSKTGHLFDSLLKKNEEYLSLAEHQTILAAETARRLEEREKLLEVQSLIFQNDCYYVEEGVLSDCPGCDYDGRFQLKHHDQCVYVLSRKALAILDSILTNSEATKGA